MLSEKHSKLKAKKPLNQCGGTLKKSAKGLQRSNQTLKQANKGISKGGRIKVRKATKEEQEQDRIERDAMWRLFNDHWNTKPRVCEQCGRVLWGENLSIYHHHILEKGNERYKHLKYNLDNLMMLCGNCHSQVTNGYPGDRVIERTAEAKIRFNV